MSLASSACEEGPSQRKRDLTAFFSSRRPDDASTQHNVGDEQPQKKGKGARPAKKDVKKKVDRAGVKETTSKVLEVAEDRGSASPPAEERPLQKDVTEVIDGDDEQAGHLPTPMPSTPLFSGDQVDLTKDATDFAALDMPSDEMEADRVIAAVFPTFASVAKSKMTGETKEVDIAGLEKAAMAIARSMIDKTQSSPKVKSTPELREAEQCLEAGVDLRSKWGVRFSRAADGANNPGYRGTRSERLAFRSAWMSAKISEIRRELVQVTESAKVDENVGVYRPMSIIYRNQGGDADPYALRATLHYVGRCIKMGEPWLKFNDWTLRMEYLEVETRKIESFKRAWQSFERRTVDCGNVDGDIDGDIKDKQSNMGKSPAPAQYPGKVVAPKQDLQSPSSKDPKLTKQKTELEKSWAAAVATKKEFSAVVMAGDGVIHSSGDGKSESWTTLSQDIELLKKALTKLRSGLGAFGADLVMKDSKHVRKAWKNDEAGLTTACKLFTNSTEALIADVSRQTRRLIAMHDARVSIE